MDRKEAAWEERRADLSQQMKSVGAAKREAGENEKNFPRFPQKSRKIFFDQSKGPVSSACKGPVYSG